MSFSWSDFLSSVAEVGEEIIVGAATSNQPLATLDPAHPIVSSAVAGGQIAGKALAATGVPVQQFAELVLAAAQMFAPARMSIPPAG